MPITLRLGLYYATIFAGTGVSLPYIAVWFRAPGLNGAQIGAILSAPMLARVLTGPALGLWADGFRLRRTPMALLGAAAAAGYAALGFMHGFWAWFVAWFVGATAIAALTPLADVVA
ncbi:MFS transporter, partial [Streptococcus pyogenes]|uniref:MFS transporter n=1 Tax=Streptococcus pyogenes TaxID=1314 RepID=UPI0011E6FAEA